MHKIHTPFHPSLSAGAAIIADEDGKFQHLAAMIGGKGVL